MSQPHLLLRLPNTQACQLVEKLLQHQVPQCEVIDGMHDCQQRPLCRWMHRLPSQSLGEVHGHLSDAIDVLERSRHAFKSVQLAALRQRLSGLLEELSNYDDYGKS